MENNITEVWFQDDKIFIKTNMDEIKSHPLSWFPRLHNASKELLMDFTLSPFGIHWEKLDEDLSLDGFFHFTNQSPVLEQK